MADIQNGRCFDRIAPVNEPPIMQNGSLILQPHDVGWIIAGAFTFVAIAVSFWLIDRHLVWYTNKREQRYIVRILFMVPIYAVISFASYLFWNHSTALLLIRDCYESTVLTAFFYLLLTYLSPDPAEQKEIFRKVGLSREREREARARGVTPGHWMFPLGFVKWMPEDGLFFFQLMKWGVLQYCVIRPVTTLIAVTLNYIGLYCEDSWSPGWGHVYITVIVSISVSVAMYCLIQLYLPIAPYLAPQKPILKLVAIKAVVFLTFWQSTLISVVQTFGGIKDTPTMTADNISTGISALAETLEMMLFAILHIFAFTYRPYRAPPGPTPRLRALAHAFDFRETLRELVAGAVYLAHRARGRETDVQARREAALERVFGRSRMDIAGRVPAPPEKEKGVTVRVEEDVWTGPPDGEALWLREEARARSGKGYEKVRSGSGFEKLSGKRGEFRDDRRGSAPKAKYDLLRQVEQVGDPTSEVRKERLWWRDAYSTVSGFGQDQQRDKPAEKAKPPLLFDHDIRYDDPPPVSSLRSYRDTRRNANMQQVAVVAPIPRQATGPLISAFTTAHPSSGYAPVHNALQLHPGPPLPSPPTDTLSPLPTSPSQAPSVSSDSFLGRAFGTVAYTSASSEVTVSPRLSSATSHTEHVHVHAQPISVPRQAEVVRQARHRLSTEGEVGPRMGTITEVPPPPASRPRGSTIGPAPRSPQELPRAQRPGGARRPTPGAGPRRLSAPPELRPVLEWRRSSGMPGMNRFTPTPSRIVLPAPLAPAASQPPRPQHDVPHAPGVGSHTPTGIEDVARR